MRAAPPPLPEPLFDPLPITVAVWYAPELGEHRATGTRSKGRPNGDQIVTHYDVQSGDAHLTVLRRMISAAFRHVKPLSSEPGGPIDDPTVDLIAMPTVAWVEYGAGATVRYRISLILPDGEHFTNIFVSGSASESVPEQRWLEVAMRDAAAQILVRLTTNEKLEKWLAERHRAAAPDRRRNS
ncbi:hypothetical protein [Desertibaculum subflavum]|uniref:hypothetical protein n=1 Tax=Desertibaculum subflavum TaxID=2268458 RepID=UPI000E6653C8